MSIDQTVAILGSGIMGRAILEGLLATGTVDRSRLVATARRPEIARQVAQKLGVEVLVDNAEAVRRADVAILCVKPQAAAEVLEPEAVKAGLGGKLLVSICAGVRTAQLGAWLPDTAIVRAMPNTPIVIREGMTAVVPGPRCSEAHLAFAEQVFASVGRCRVLEEKHIDAITALGGSGPAFACMILEALADGGVMMGLPRDVAVEVAAQTMQGAARLVLESGEHPAALKDRVTTPAGCTIAGLLTMEDGKIRSTLARTIQEATIVASKLGQPPSS